MFRQSEIDKMIKKRRVSVLISYLFRIIVFKFNKRLVNNFININFSHLIKKLITLN